MTASDGVKQPEVWLRGPVPGVPAALQPVAHALLQAREDVEALAATLPDGLLWQRPGGVASPGFHLQHLRGVVDRLFTYARAQPLSEEQRRDLELEGTSSGAGTLSLVRAFSEQIEQGLAQLRATDPLTLSEPRAVGRQRLPSTVGGLLFHAAEHVQRHVGQLLVTVRVQQGQ
jgi:uncharacterized damage-inducible protein DinB